jgi:hypothetical protein
MSMAAGGGNLLELQGPPILSKGLKSLIALPLTFYKKLGGNNGLAKPVSYIFFLLSGLSIFFLFRKKKQSPVFHRLDKHAVAIHLPAVTLLLFSGSNGKFLVTIYPLCAILIAAAVHEFILGSEKVHRSWVLVTSLGILILFCSNLYGIQKQARYFSEYKKAKNQIHQAIPDSSATVMGANLFSVGFHSQPYYSVSGLNPYLGLLRQPFSEAATSVHTNYIILEDFTVYRLSSFRSKEWMNEMFEFLDKHCTLVKELHVNTFVGFLVGEPGPFPPQWNNPGAKKNFITMIRIYKYNS